MSTLSSIRVLAATLACPALKWAPLRWLCYCLCALAAASAIARDAARFVGTDLWIGSGSERFALRGMSDKDRGDHQIDSRVLDVARRGETWYLMVITSEYSTPYGSIAMCGSGVETDVRWLVVEHRHIARQLHHVFASCDNSADGKVDTAHNGTITIRVSQFGGNSAASPASSGNEADTTITYDRRHPEAGWKALGTTLRR